MLALEGNVLNSLAIGRETSIPPEVLTDSKFSRGEVFSINCRVC